jgi:hypothetical protein
MDGGKVAEQLLSRITLKEAARAFLNDMAEVAGYGADRHGPMRKVSAYVMNRPILTVPDPWFFAGMVALEATKICDLFQPREADVLMREILNGSGSHRWTQRQAASAPYSRAHWPPRMRRGRPEQ